MTSTSRKTRTAEELDKLLRAKGLSQNQVAGASFTNQGYISQVTNGQRLPSAKWLNLVADALQLNRDERLALHRAAASDHGFEIDLCEG